MLRNSDLNKPCSRPPADAIWIENASSFLRSPVSSLPSLVTSVTTFDTRDGV